MPKTILLIENDAAFARDLTEALESAGFRVRVTGDGKEGLDLARDVAPAAIVLCVELPKMSGYSICNKLKKDEALKGIPLVLASAEATDETFELHRKLKTHAEAYLLKPYRPAALVSQLGQLLGLPAGTASAGTGHSDEEVVSLEEELGLEALGGDPETELPALDLGSLPDEPAGAPAQAGGHDEDLRLLDDAFDGLSGPAGPSPAAGEAPPGFGLEVQKPVAVDDVDAAADSLPEDDELAGRAALDAAAGMADEADLALGALDGDASAGQALDALDALTAPPSPGARPGDPGPELDLDRELAAVIDLAPEPSAARPALDLVPDEPAAPAPASPFSRPSHGGGAEAAELARLEADLAERRAAVAARDAELRDLHDQVDALTTRAVEAESALAERDAEIAALKARGEAQAAQLKRGEADVKAGREEARRAADQARAAEDRVRAADERTRAAEALVVPAQERLRAAEEKARAAESRAATALGEAEKLRGAHAEVSRSLVARTAELATAATQAARLQEVEREVERLETELIVARGEVEGARSEVEKRGAELQERIGDLEAANSKNEERVVKAYLKIKGDEKVRDKARKALAIALQLLEEGLPPEAAEKRSATQAATAKLE